MVLQDSQAIADVDNDTAYAVTGLTAGKQYLFKVEAKSVLGPVSLDGPSVVVTTVDLQTPTWPQLSKLKASVLGSDSVTLT